MLGQGQDEFGAIQPSSIEKAVYEKELFAFRMAEIPSNMKKRFEYDGSGNAVYIGYAPTGLAEGGDSNGLGWLLWELTYDVSNNCTAIDIAYGNWTDRATYTYG